MFSLVWPFCPFIYFFLLSSFHVAADAVAEARVAISAEADIVGFSIIAYYVCCSLPYLYNNYFGCDYVWERKGQSNSLQKYEHTQ